MTVYRIKEWNEHFVKRDAARTRKLPWIALPTRHDGLQFRRLARRPGGMEAYGAFLLMATVASKCPIQGVLADEKNRPLTAVDLADRTGFPEDGFARAFEILADPSIGWLVKEPEDAHAGNFGDSAGKNRKSAGKIPDSAGRNDKSAVLRDETRRDETERTPQTASDGDIFSGEDHSETDESLLHLVRTRIRWQVKDPDVQAQYQSSVLAWLRSPDRKLLLDVAEKESRERRKAVPWWELEEILAERKKSSGPSIRTPLLVTRAHQLLSIHGLQRVQELTRIPFESALVAIEALTINPDLVDLVEQGAA